MHKNIKSGSKKSEKIWRKNEEAYSKFPPSKRRKLKNRDLEVEKQLLKILQDKGYKVDPKQQLKGTIKKGWKANLEEKKREIQNANKFCEILKKEKFNFVSGVPDGTQKYIIENLSKDSRIKHIPAVRESEAIGIAAGASLAGKNSIVYMQNSGLLNSINEITSLLIPYKIPILLLVGFRGAPGEDAPQHFENGKSTIKILNDIGVYTQLLTKWNMKEVVSNAVKWMKNKSLPCVILIIKGALK